MMTFVRTTHDIDKCFITSNTMSCTLFSVKRWCAFALSILRDRDITTLLIHQESLASRGVGHYSARFIFLIFLFLFFLLSFFGASFRGFYPLQQLAQRSALIVLIHIKGHKATSTKRERGVQSPHTEWNAWELFKLATTGTLITSSLAITRTSKWVGRQWILFMDRLFAFLVQEQRRQNLVQSPAGGRTNESNLQL